MEEHTCATEQLRGVTPDEADRLGFETRQLDEPLQAAQEAPESCENLSSKPGPPPQVEVPTEPRRELEELSRDDLNDGMDTEEQLNPLEGAGETASSTEIPDRETVGSPEFKSARLEEPLDEEQEKIEEDDASRISPGETLVPKNPGNPQHQPVLFWTNVSMVAKSHFTNCLRGMCQCTKRQNVFSETSGSPMGQSKFIHRWRLRRFVSRFHGKLVCTQELHIETQTLVYWILPVTPCP